VPSHTTKYQKYIVRILFSLIFAVFLLYVILAINS
jgi:hypothetical protein